MKLLDLVEGYYDPPEYPDSDERFVEDSLNDVTPIFKLVGWDKRYGTVVVSHIELGSKYVFHEDSIPGEFMIDSYYEVEDADEDGRYSYWEASGNPEMIEPSLVVYATVQFNEEMITKDASEFLNDWDKLLLLTPQTMQVLSRDDNDLFKTIIKIISDSLKTK